MKRCSKCHIEKPLEEFYRHNTASDGYQPRCKECAKRDSRAARAKRLDYYKEYDRTRNMLENRREGRKAYAKTEKAKKIRSESGMRYKRANREKARATDAVMKAKIRGRLIPEPCFVCGEQAQAHHVAYDMPLDVVWLCVKHHVEVHNMARQIERERQDIPFHGGPK